VLAKLCRRSCSRTSASPAARRTGSQTYETSEMGEPLRMSDGNTHSLRRSTPLNSSSAAAPSGITLAPVFESGSRKEPRSKSISDQRNRRISLSRAPVSAKRRMIAMGAE